MQLESSSQRDGHKTDKPVSSYIVLYQRFKDLLCRLSHLVQYAEMLLCARQVVLSRAVWLVVRDYHRAPLSFDAELDSSEQYQLQPPPPPPSPSPSHQVSASLINSAVAQTLAPFAARQLHWLDKTCYERAQRAWREMHEINMTWCNMAATMEPLLHSMWLFNFCFTLGVIDGKHGQQQQLRPYDPQTRREGILHDLHLKAQVELLRGWLVFLNEQVRPKLKQSLHHLDMAARSKLPFCFASQ